MEVDLHRRRNVRANGLYRCAIETNEVHSNDSNNVKYREIVYVGMYTTGGKGCVWQRERDRVSMYNYTCELKHLCMICQPKVLL